MPVSWRQEYGQESGSEKGRRNYAIAAVSPYSHSIVLGNGNVLNSTSNFFCTQRRTVARVRQKFPLLNSKENFVHPNLLGFSDYRQRLVDFPLTVAADR